MSKKKQSPNLVFLDSLARSMTRSWKNGNLEVVLEDLEMLSGLECVFVVMSMVGNMTTEETSKLGKMIHENLRTS